MNAFRPWENVTKEATCKKCPEGSIGVCQAERRVGSLWNQRTGKSGAGCVERQETSLQGMTRMPHQRPAFSHRQSCLLGRNKRNRGTHSRLEGIEEDKNPS